MDSSPAKATSNNKELSDKLIRIDDNVFFGTIDSHKNQPLIKELKIQRIFAINVHHIKKSERMSQIYYKELPLNDFYRTALILVFEQSYQYINESQLYDEPILIISQNLKSEGSALMIAFVMKKYKITCAEALKQLTANGIRKPKDFTKQLKLWFKMDFHINPLDPELRQTLFKAFKYLLEYQILIRELSTETHQQFRDLCLSYFYCFEDMDLDEKDWKSGLCSYRCSKCDKKLFDESVVIRNITQTENQCQNLFTEPIDWVIHKMIFGTTDINTAKQYLNSGQISCLSCNQSIGEYNWRSIYQCNCDLHSGIEHLVFKFNSDSIKMSYF